MTALYWLVGVLGSTLIGAEVIAWCGPAQRALLRRAAARLPIEYRARYAEEWMAELDASPRGPVTRLLFTVTLLVRARRLEVALQERTRDLAAVLLELQTRRMKAVILQWWIIDNVVQVGRVILAEAPNGERYAWLMEGRVLTRISVPDVNFGFEHVQPGDIRVLPRRRPVATDAVDSQRAPDASAVGEASLPSPILETGS